MPRLSDLLLGLTAAALLTVTATPAHAVADRRDGPVMLRALNDLMSFAAPGRLVRYDNPETGNQGSVTALRQFREGGRLCWDYSRNYFDGATEMIVNGTACELELGLWTVSREGAARPKTGGGAWTEPGTQPAQPAAPAAAPASSGYDRAMVRETQQLLTDLGYRPGPVDGAYGRKTGAAISEYQRTAGLSVTGQPSQPLLQSLRSSKAAMRGSATGAATGTTTTTTLQPTVQPAPQPAPAPAPTPTPTTTTDAGSTGGSSGGGWVNPDSQAAPASPSPAPAAIPPPPPPPPPEPQ